MEDLKDIANEGSFEERALKLIDKLFLNDILFLKENGIKDDKDKEEAMDKSKFSVLKEVNRGNYDLKKASFIKKLNLEFL